MITSSGPDWVAQRGRGAVRHVLALDDRDPTVGGDGEDAVGLQVEIARAAAQVDRVALAPVLDMEADRPALIVIHSGIHREEQPAAAVAERRAEPVEAAHWPLRVFEGEGDLVPPGIVAAGGEAGALETALLARTGDLGLAPRRRRLRLGLAAGQHQTCK